MQKLFLLFLLLFLLKTSQAQVGIGTATPNASSVLDLTATDRGFLPPRMTAQQRKAIASPTAGLVVFDTDAGQLFLYDGISWSALSATGNSNTQTPTQVFPSNGQQVSNSNFGIEVDMSDTYAVVGCPGASNGALTFAGAVYVYKKNAAGTWVQVATLKPPDPKANAYFGASVSISGNYIAVGAPRFTSGTLTDAGRVYIFVKGNGEAWNLNWAFTGSSNPIGGEKFGYSVAIGTTSAFGPVLIVGSPGAPQGAGSLTGSATTFRFNGGN